jgi:hypothetical protein
MQHTIDKFYCLYDAKGKILPVVMYSINGYAFTFDHLSPEVEKDPNIINLAKKHHKTYTMEDLYLSSGYLIMEECHPCFFEMALENPELLPED